MNPLWKWTKRGLETPHPPTKEDLESSRHKAMAGFKFVGAGWYEAHKCLVLNVSGGHHVYFYARDPRPELMELGLYPDRP